MGVKLVPLGQVNRGSQKTKKERSQRFVGGGKRGLQVGHVKEKTKICRLRAKFLERVLQGSTVQIAVKGATLLGGVEEKMEGRRRGHGRPLVRGGDRSCKGIQKRSKKGHAQEGSDSQRGKDAKRAKFSIELGGGKGIIPGN